MKRLLVALLTLLLALSACAGEGELSDTAPLGPPFRFDITGVDSELQQWVGDAAADWNLRIGKDLIRIDPDGPHKVVMGDVPDNGSDLVERSHGVWTVTFIRVPGVQLENCFKVQARHAFGHVLEAYFPENESDPRHSIHSEDVMFAGLGCNKLLTARDIAAIRW